MCACMKYLWPHLNNDANTEPRCVHNVYCWVISTSLSFPKNRALCLVFIASRSSPCIYMCSAGECQCSDTFLCHCKPAASTNLPHVSFMSFHVLLFLLSINLNISGLLSKWQYVQPLLKSMQRAAFVTTYSPLPYGISLLLDFCQILSTEPLN